ncbi:MAG: hypothetical protein JXB85_08270 [Anaerolineales bacterium]|nr:hypothetical protein [Anaerolineales bacterium]
MDHVKAHDRKWGWAYDLLFLLVLLAGTALRFTGLDWGNLMHQHPDELFLSSVTIDVQPVDNLGDYFDTANSTLNPQNRGHGFFTYGTLPVFMVRYAAGWFGQIDIKYFGRQVSAVMDLGTIALLYFIVARVYGRRVALLGAAFSALAVMQIQQSHFYTSDNFVNFFMYLTLLFAVLIATHPWRRETAETGSREERPAGQGRRLARWLRDPLAWYSLGFGLAFGMAMASKVNALPLAALLPAALAVAYFREAGARPDLERPRFEAFIVAAWAYALIGGLASLLAFRVFQPYAFNGLILNPAWFASLSEQRAQVGADLPWNLQWVRRSPLYSFENLTVWGLGLPLGILAWAGFVWMGWRMLRQREWNQHILLWGWTAFYFTWQSLQFNPTMRYQLPVYPLLAMMAAWAVFQLWVGGRRSLSPEKRARQSGTRTSFPGFWSFLSVFVGGAVLVATAIWAAAFTGIYTRTEPRVAASEWIYANAPGPINLQIESIDGTTYQQPLPLFAGTLLQQGQPYPVHFVAQRDGLLTGATFPHLADSSGSRLSTLSLSLVSSAAPDRLLTWGSLSGDFTPGADARGGPQAIVFPDPVPLDAGQLYMLNLEAFDGILTLSGSALVNETDYDFGLPFRVSGYDGFGGIYRGDLNLQVYWPDNSEKLAHLVTTLEEGDYIIIPTNHQYGQITRIPERYPLTTYYYRELIGCPPEADILWCYQVAEPGTFQGRLGYELVAVFNSYPTFGSLVLNDQAAEEAFTFYDHPKVMVFQRSPGFDSRQVAASLGTVDLSRAVHLTPLQADDYRDMLLPADRLADQQAGGTWSDLFDRAGLLNRYPALGLVVWYLVIFGIGLLAYPIVRAALPGLPDRGYPLARFAGLLLWAWFAWMAGSAGIPYSRMTILLALLGLAVLGGGLAYRQRDELRQEWRTRRRYFLMVEALFLLLFLVDLGIRLGNPDLWHPAKGGERPMNFSYFNAILKSTSFPPYDPWFAGGYINYYYYGYVIAATPVKLLGIVPSVAWNLLLPTLYAILGLGAFSVGWNITYRQDAPDSGRWWSQLATPHFLAGFGALAAMVLLGNLGIVQLFFQGFARLGAPGGIITDGDIFQRCFWALKGFFQTLRGVPLPFGRGDWYWFPSRVIPAGAGNEITEFPVFTFLYSDMHAHNWAMPVQVLAISWAFSVLKSRARWGSVFNLVVCFLFGGLTIGALYPINLSDMYTYLPLAYVALAYTLWRHADVDALPWPGKLSPATRRVVLIVASIVTLTGLAFLFYQPYRHWYVQPYGDVAIWKGPRTPLSSYLVHWGLYLFVLVSWMAWETRQWMAATPLSALRKLKPYTTLILGSLALLVGSMLVQQISVMLKSNYVPWMGVSVIWLILPLAAWAGVLLLRPGLSDPKRAVLFLFGTALMLTLMVEIVAVVGDIGRMNTIFKFYLQAWILLGVCAAAAFTWLMPEIASWRFRARAAWQGTATVLITCAALFLLLGGMDKIRDRMAPEAPHSLDSMAFMESAQFADFGVVMNLDEDYRAILWMQAHISGSPVIVEANIPEYRWGTRYTIYTGLPGVVGWNWHQRQQRGVTEAWVWNRVTEIERFYRTTDATVARDFLRRYNVGYIVVGQLERAVYVEGYGLDKFEWFEGRLWREVYRDGQTVIYEVLPEVLNP